MSSHEKLQIAIIGPGMITQLQILTSIYQLQRLDIVGDISVIGTRCQSLKSLAEDATLARAFPGQSFTPYPDYRSADAKKQYRDIYKKVLKKLPPRQCVVVATTDQMHYDAIK